MLVLLCLRHLISREKYIEESYFLSKVLFCQLVESLILCFIWWYLYCTGFDFHHHQRARFENRHLKLSQTTKFIHFEPSEEKLYIEVNFWGILKITIFRIKQCALPKNQNQPRPERLIFSLYIYWRTDFSIRRLWIVSLLCFIMILMTDH
jgi:hypothetical protein